MKKAQVIGQVFIFIIAAVIFVMILFYGYRAITGFLDTKEEVEVANFKTTIESKVKSVRISYGSRRKVVLSLPAKYQEFCAVDPNMTGVHLQEFQQLHPLMHNAWRSDQSNTIFLRPLLETAIQIEDIAVTGPTYPDQPGYLCLPIINGQLVIGLEGLGDRAQVIEWVN